MADKSKKDQTSKDESNKSTDESEKRIMDEKSNKNQTSNDTSDKLTDGSEKKNTDEKTGLKAQDDSSKDSNNSPALDEDTAKLPADSATQLTEDFQENLKRQYDSYRLTAKTLMYLIDHMDREKVSQWLSRLDEMNDEEGQMERMYYLKYLVATLSSSFGLEEPFTALPPHTIKSLSLALPPAVFAELLDRDENTAELMSRKPAGAQTPVTERRPPIEHYDYNDRLFFEQQLFPPEGLICYAAAFSALPEDE